MVFGYSCLVCFSLLFSVACYAAAESNYGSTEDDGSLERCMNQLADASGDLFDWASVNPSLLVSLALDLNRTGSCRWEAFIDEDTQVLLQETSRKLEATKTGKRRHDTLDTRPTPAPTGGSSPGTTVHITNERDFALLLPSQKGGMNNAFIACSFG